MKRTISDNTMKALTRFRYGIISPLVKERPKAPSIKESIVKLIGYFFSGKHHCSPPGFFHRLMLRLIRRPIVQNTLYRCPCGKVHELYDSTNGDDFWFHITDQDAAMKKWIDSGGQA